RRLALLTSLAPLTHRIPMTVALAALTVTVVGLMVGVELAVAAVLNPIIHGLAVGPSLEAGAHGARMLGRLMPVLVHHLARADGGPRGGHGRRRRRAVAHGRCAAGRERGAVGRGAGPDQQPHLDLDGRLPPRRLARAAPPLGRLPSRAGGAGRRGVRARGHDGGTAVDAVPRRDRARPQRANIVVSKAY